MTSTIRATPDPSGRLRNNAVAIRFMIVAGALVAITSLLAKALGADTASTTGLHPFQVSAGRFVFAFLALVLFLSLRPGHRPRIAGANWRLHLARALSGWLGATCMFGAVARMPVTEATALTFLSPLVTMGLATVMLGESLTLRKYAAAAVAVFGAILILRPGAETFQAAGLLALAAAALMGLEAIFVKRLSDSEPALRVMLINNGIGAVTSLTVALFVWTQPSAQQWVLLIALGVVMICAQANFIQAMKRGDASLVIPAFYSVLVFAALYDFAIYGVVPAATALIGSAAIVTGALILARKDAALR